MQLPLAAPEADGHAFRCAQWRHADRAPAPPRELAVSSSTTSQRYELDPGLVAPDPDAGPAAVRSSGDAAGGPVYRRSPGGDAVVPTGRVLVRPSPSDQVDAHRAELAAAGYTIDSVLSYAPHAA